MKIRKQIGAIAVAVAALAAVGGVATPASAVTAAQVTGSYVALGDSYAAGNGAGDYDPASGDCHRSPHAYPAVWAAAYPSMKRVSYACSGATTGDVFGTGPTAPEVAASLAGATEVSLSVGGNDVGFVPTLTNCLLGTDQQCAAYLNSATIPAITAIAPVLDATYARLRALAPHARVVIVGYPQLFDPTTACSWSAAKRQLINSASELMSATISARAAAAGFSYVDTRPVFAGHGVCAAAPWIHREFEGATFEWFHPTAAGHAAEAAALPAPQAPAQVSYAGGKLNVAIRSDVQNSAQRVVIWVNGKYVAETYRGSSYYAATTNTPNLVNLTPVGTVNAGDRVQVGIVPGAPGDSIPAPGSVTLLVDTQAGAIEAAGLTPDGHLAVTMATSLYLSSTHVTFSVNGVYHGATNSGVGYYVNGYRDSTSAHLTTSDGGFRHGDHLTITAGSQTVYDTYL